MQNSEHRILTTHVGSLPRHPPLRDLLVKRERGDEVDPAEMQRQVETSVAEVIAKQIEAGIDIGNNGEQPRVGFSTYVATRMQGFGGESQRPQSQDLEDFPDYAAVRRARRLQSSKIENAPQAVVYRALYDRRLARRYCHRHAERLLQHLRALCLRPRPANAA
jgi:5-methyltetrahydropteroyltriglutamate--homocysteine methyltransferase